MRSCEPCEARSPWREHSGPRRRVWPRSGFRAEGYFRVRVEGGAMERVLILTADSGEELEAYYMLYRLRESGYEVDVAAPARKTLQLAVHDFEPGWDTYVERPGRRLDADLAFSEVDPERYAAVLIPGGRAPEVIRN